jgi:uncharacterized protein YybS (DUF2232 family)
MTPSPAAFVRFGKATVITVLLGVCMAFLPLGPALIMPFLALPVAHLLARWGLPYAVLLVLISGGLVFLLADLGMASLVFLVLLTMGVTLGLAVRRYWTFGRTLVSTAAAAVVAFVAWGAIMWLALGVDMTLLRDASNASINNAATVYNEMGVSQASTDAVSSQLRQIFDVLPYLVPGLLAVGALLLAGCAIVLAYAIFPRLRERVEVRLSLTGFRMHWAAAYASIAGLALVVASRGAGGWRDVLLYSGLNVLLVSQTFFFYQGLALVHWYVTTRQLGRGFRAFLYVVAVLAQALLQITGLLGLFDTWLDCRKRFALKTPGAGPVR